ncbi:MULTISPECIES: hypothetical protein [Pseudomonas]|uniref:hypothetical protein n=1 Tax=Pseudomonas TaxID=286 RepID=UPI000F79D90A|nr:MULTISPECIES: hypothetical protein [Pseudomonas]
MDHAPTTQPAEIVPPFLIQDGQVVIRDALIGSVGLRTETPKERMEADIKRRFLAGLTFSWNV